jgi:hypothetical protein
VNGFNGIQVLSTGMALVALMSASSTLAVGKTRFFVECHSFVSAGGNATGNYAYHLRSYGFAESVENGVDINLDEEKIVLSVESKQSGQEEYSKLYTDLPLVKAQEQPCQDGTCKQVDYEPKDFEGKLSVTYDKDNGSIQIKHAIAPGVSVQGRGGCLFVALPTRD